MRISNARAAGLAVSLALAAACAGTPEMPPETQAIRDYIEVGELREVDRVRTHGSDKWAPATLYFAVYSGRDGRFLLAFARMCREMVDNTSITADRRYDHNVMRQGIDTLRGCRIDKIYPLTDAQAQEIEALANTGGNRN
jgi:hypothetical protein